MCADIAVGRVAVKFCEAVFPVPASVPFDVNAVIGVPNLFGGC